MDPIASMSAQLFTLGTNLVEKSIAGLTPGELLGSPREGANPILWIFGHLTNSRCLIVNLLGGTIVQLGSYEFMFAVSLAAAAVALFFSRRVRVV